MTETFDMKQAKRLYQPDTRPVSNLLARLEHVQGAGEGKYRAQCPAHDGQSRRSLSIREMPDGTVMLKCFSHDCAAVDIVQAVGLELADLFPARIDHHTPPQERERWRQFASLNQRENALKEVLVSLRVVFIAAQDIRAGRVLTEQDHQRLGQAEKEIDRIGRMIHG